MKRAVKVAVGKYRSEILMLGFVAEILVSPVADGHPLIGGFLALTLMVLIFAGASYMANRRILQYVAIPVAGVWLIARLLEAFADPRHFYAHMSPIAGFVLSCSVLWAILDRFDRVSKITRSVIAEAFTCYLVIASAFSQLYWVLNRLIANPFNQVIPEAKIGTLMYFSMITLSGVGYGGIIPTNPCVRLVAALENMIGIFYVAVVVARLVSSYRARSHSREVESERHLGS
jgi:voltage-gated potassium channel